MNDLVKQGYYGKQLKVRQKQWRNEAYPEVAKTIREKLTPDLQPETEKWYAAAMDDPNLPQGIKDELKRAYQHQRELTRYFGGNHPIADEDLKKFNEWLKEQREGVGRSVQKVIEAAAE